MDKRNPELLGFDTCLFTFPAKNVSHADSTQTILTWARAILAT